MGLTRLVIGWLKQSLRACPARALARAIRTIAVVGDRYIVLLEAQVSLDPAASKRTVVDPSSA